MATLVENHVVLNGPEFRPPTGARAKSSRPWSWTRLPRRFELALLDAIRLGDLTVPVTSVDFAGSGLAGLDKASDYEAPHRIFDSLPRLPVTDARHRHACPNKYEISRD